MSSDSPATAASNPWLDASYHVLDGYLRANGALLRALGVSGASPSPTRGEAERSHAAIEPAATDWTVERSAETVAELGVGDWVRFEKTVDPSDVSAFAGASGDTNRLHLDESFAEETLFDGRIVHGTLVAGTISAALARFPGVTIYLSQDLAFEEPVRVGERVAAEAEIVEALGDDRYRVHTTVHDEDGESVIDGEAIVLIRDAPEE